MFFITAVMKTLHSMKRFLNEEECRSVAKAGVWWSNELAVTLAAKPPIVVEKALGVLKVYKMQGWHDITAMHMKSKFCSRTHLV